MQEYVSPSTIKKQYQISFNSLNNWAKQGLIEYIVTPGGQKKYKYNSVVQVLGQPEKAQPTPDKKTVIIYARVSSQKQAKDGDLQRQLEKLEIKFKQQFPNETYIIKKDVGSGINWKRKGFVFCLDQAHSRNISKIVISDKDRLCRFAFDLVQHIFKLFGVEILVFNENNELGEIEENNKRTELSDDLLAIVNVFVAQANGYRSARNKKLFNHGQKSKATQEQSVKQFEVELQNQESEDLSDRNSGSETETNDGNSEMDL